MRLSAVEALSQERNDLISEEYYMLLNEYLEYWQKDETGEDSLSEDVQDVPGGEKECQ